MLNYCVLIMFDIIYVIYHFEIFTKKKKIMTRVFSFKLSYIKKKKKSNTIIYYHHVIIIYI